MTRNPIHTFLQVLGGDIPDQLSLGGFRRFEVVLYWVLLAKRLIPGLPYDGAVARAMCVAT